jgi:integrase-like protein
MPRWGCPTCVPPTKEQTMTPLRARMIEDMKLGGLADKTQEVYQQAVRGLAKHYRRPPDQLSEAEVRRYLLDVKERGAARGTFKTCHYGIQFFYRQTLGRDWPLFKKRSDCPSRSGCRRPSRMPRSSGSSATSAIRSTRPALP